MTVSRMDKSDPHKVKEVAPFLKNLRKMLDVESDDILRWTTNGRAFEIHDMEQMMDYVLPKYFKHRKYTSFQRQLNYFNFKKWTKSKAVVCTFSNEFFVRDQPELAWRIARKKSVTLGGYKSVASARKNAPVQGKRMDEMTYEGNWKVEEMAIRVPRGVKRDLYGGESFPSPTDMDMMLSEQDVTTHRYYTMNHVVQPSESEMESLDWIDNFLPSLEVNPKPEDQFHMNPLMRNSPYMFTASLQPPSDYICMASM